jgi:hypothetical protein
MEVHHHAHPAPLSRERSDSGGGTRKKWTHYFWEFLMLFLAVFCGFLAEYTLEHKIEKNRERQYVKSFMEDLVADTLSLNTRIYFCDLTIRKVDSAIAVLTYPGKEEVAGEIYYFLRGLHRSDVFSVNDRTIVQLRNAGGMRLVSSKAVSDSMIDYYKKVEFISFIYEEQMEFRRSLRPYFPQLFDGVDYGNFIDENNVIVRSARPVKLRITNPDAFNACILIISNIKGINLGIKRRLVELKEKAKHIREFIRHEYHLE